VREATHQTIRVWGSTLAVAFAFVVGLNACGSDQTTTTRRSPGEDFVAKASDFRNLHTMTHVRGFYIDNRLGHLVEALEVANNPSGGRYPVGTIIQLVPQEAMVKRRHGFDPSTDDWEFFSLEVSARGTVIKVRGKHVLNRFGMSCAGCHGAADPRFDFVCEQTHGCAPLPVGHDVFVFLQETDPRPI
jgi:hypothetical protein